MPPILFYMNWLGCALPEIIFHLFCEVGMEICTLCVCCRIIYINGLALKHIERWSPNHEIKKGEILFGDCAWQCHFCSFTFQAVGVTPRGRYYYLCFKKGNNVAHKEFLWEWSIKGWAYILRIHFQTNTHLEVIFDHGFMILAI